MDYNSLFSPTPCFHNPGSRMQGQCLSWSCAIRQEMNLLAWGVNDSGVFTSVQHFIKINHLILWKLCLKEEQASHWNNKNNTHRKLAHLLPKSSWGIIRETSHVTSQGKEEERRRRGKERKKLKKKRDKWLPRDRKMSLNNLRSASGLNNQRGRRFFACLIL